MSTKNKYKLMGFVALSLALALSAKAQTPETSRSLRQIGVEFHGGDPLNPTPNSLIGQFLERTNAQTIVRQFPNSPVGNLIPPYQLGPEKLAIALGPDAMADFIELFRGTNYFFIYHTPNSNTFHFVYKGFDGSYATMSPNPIRFTAQTTLLIPILLSDSEARRLDNFFNTTALIGSGWTRAPWMLTGSSGTYANPSGFQGCTNWVGQLPIGDELVNEYIYPSGDVDGATPILSTLREYNTPLNFTAAQDVALRSVWTVPGRKQLGEMLDPMANRRGEFANVGWVTYTAVGTLPLNRVPVVFYQVNDPSVPLAPAFPLNIAPYK